MQAPLTTQDYMMVLSILLMLDVLFTSMLRIVGSGAHTVNFPLEEFSGLNSSNAAIFDCYKDLLQSTQRCDNERLLYYQRKGGGEYFGFGSEFNYHLSGALMVAVANKQRLVLVRDKSELTGYECLETQFWDCYLSFPCKDSVVDYKDVKNVNAKNRHANTYYSQVNNVHSVPSLTDVLRLRCNAGQYLRPGENVSVSIVRAVEDTVVGHLFHLNAETEKKVEEFVQFSGLAGKQYLAVHIRATDKAKELNDYAWSTLHNMNRLYSCISEYMNVPVKLNYALISSDDCSLVDALSKKFPKSIHIVSPCYIHSMKYEIIPKSFRAVINLADPRHGDTHDKASNYFRTLRLLGELRLWSDATQYFGLYQSNLGRLTYRLRALKYPIFRTHDILCRRTDHTRMDGHEANIY